MKSAKAPTQPAHTSQSITDVPASGTYATASVIDASASATYASASTTHAATSGIYAAAWKTYATACAIGLTLSLHASSANGQVTRTVTCSSNLYAAGHSAPEAPVGGGAGIMPQLVPLPRGVGRELQFVNVNGTVSYCPSCGSNGPDGTDIGSTCIITAWRGISELRGSRIRGLTGVMLSNEEPVNPPPAPLIWNNSTIAQPVITAGTRQIIFIGDGRTGINQGNTQRFVVPTEATRLFLGFVDGFCGSGHGTYGDTSGQVQVTVNYTGCIWVMQEPDSRTFCPGKPIRLRVETLGDAPRTYAWRKNGQMIDAAMNPTASAAELVLPDASASDEAMYDVVISSECGSITSLAAVVTVSTCDCLDFNNNLVFPEDQDVIDFFNVLAGGDCSVPNICNDIDFNNNTVFPEDQDVMDFFNVLAGGTCP